MSVRELALVLACGALFTLAPAGASLFPEPGEPAVLMTAPPVATQALRTALALGAAPLGRTQGGRFFVVAAPSRAVLWRLQASGPWLLVRSDARFGCGGQSVAQRSKAR